MAEVKTHLLTLIQMPSRFEYGYNSLMSARKVVPPQPWNTLHAISKCTGCPILITPALRSYYWFTLSLLCLAVDPQGICAADFCLTMEGKTNVAIVIAREPTSVAKLSADELQLHIRKITSATLAIHRDTDVTNGPRILVGASAATAKLGVLESELQGQEYLIRFIERDILLLGKDEALSYAVYDFLERFCNVRWFGPKESQTVFPKSSTLTLKPSDVRRRPALAWRAVFPWTKFEIARELYDHPSDVELDLFWKRHRIGGEAYACNHSLEGYYDRFWKKNSNNPDAFVTEHHDWFAQGYTATELEAYGGQPPQLCYSQQGVIDQVVSDARNYFDGQGAAVGTEAAGRFFAMVPMDRGGRGHWCRCPQCREQIDQKRLEENQFDSNGSASHYWFKFVNRVAREIARSHPDKCISTLAYAGYSYYPDKIQLEPNVSVQMCMHTRNYWAPGMKQDEERWYRDWIKNEKGRRPLYLWLYHCLPELQNSGGPPFHCFPGFHSHSIGRQFKQFAQDGIRGAFVEGVSDQIDIYLTLKLMDNPSLNVDILLKEFFTSYYGPAADPMQEFYLQIEDVYGNSANYPPEVRTNLRQDFFQTEEMAWKYLGTAERMAKLESLINDATRLAVCEPEKQRVALFRKAIWDHMAQGRQEYVLKLSDNR